MHIGREAIRLIERSDTHEGEPLSEAGVVAPDGDLAARAAHDALALAAVTRSGHPLRLSAKRHETGGLDQGIEHEGTAGLALAPATVTTVHDERSARQPVADGTAGAAALG